jgi:hypothetical protein
VKAYIVYPQYQTPAGPSGGNPNNVITAVGLAIKIEPIPNQAGVVAFPANRHVQLDGSAQVNAPLSGSSWFPSKFTSFQFGIEMTGTSASDGWLVTVAEEQDDPATYGGVGIPWSASFPYSATTQLFTGPSGAGGSVSNPTNVSIVQGGNTALVTDTGALQTSPRGASAFRFASGSVSPGTPVAVGGLTGATGNVIGLIATTTAVTGALGIAFGSSTQIIAWIPSNAAGASSMQFTPPPDPNAGTIFVLATTTSQPYTIAVLYSG